MSVRRVGLFFDFDGTLSPLHTPREEVKLGNELINILKLLKERFIIAVISSKDCFFLTEKACVFDYYGCVNGLELLTPNYVIVSRAALSESFSNFVSEVLNAVRYDDCLYVEIKSSVLNKVLGVSLDWRNCRGKPTCVEEFVKKAELRGFNVLRYHNQPFIDIYPTNSSKGDAVKLLKILTNVERVVYFGDSENDIPAFDEADVKVLIKHEGNDHLISIVKPNYIIKFEDLAEMIKTLVNTLGDG